MNGSPRASFEISLPWPLPCLFPNAKRRSHWRTYVKPAKKYREDCMWMTRAVIGRTIFTTPPKVAIAFYPPDLIRRDPDNLVGAAKHAIDGVADAIGHDDSTWKPTFTFHEPRRPHGAVVVTLTVEERQA